MPRAEYDPIALTYALPAYAEEGFIHTTQTPTQTLAIVHQMANRYYRADPHPYLLLTVDLDRASAPWRYDAAGPDYPHLYGPIDREAVGAMQPVVRAEDGTFLPLSREA